MGFLGSIKHHGRTIYRDIINEPLNKGLRLRFLMNYFIWQLFEKRSKSKIITLSNGLKTIVRPVPDNDAGEIGIWTRNMDYVDTEFVRKFLTKGDYIVDAGCNVGNRTIVLADIIEGALLIDAGQCAVERTKEHLLLNHLDVSKFTVLHKAVGETEGIIRFTDLGGASTQNKVVEVLSNDISYVEVEMTTIDREVEERGLHPVFIKTDVEGHDLSALKGAVRTLRSGSVKLVKFEHTSDEPLEPLLEFFRGLGWKVFTLDKSGLPDMDGINLTRELNLFAMPEKDFNEKFVK